MYALRFAGSRRFGGEQALQLFAATTALAATGGGVQYDCDGLDGGRRAGGFSGGSRHGVNWDSSSARGALPSPACVEDSAALRNLRQPRARPSNRRPPPLAI